jgi:hypothetical protein
MQGGQAMRTTVILVASLAAMMLLVLPQAESRKAPEYSVEASVEHLDDETLQVNFELNRNTPDRGEVLITRSHFKLKEGKKISAATKDWYDGNRIEMRLGRSKQVVNHVLLVIRILDEGEVVFYEELNLPIP